MTYFIYMGMTADGKVGYIGKTTDVRRRIGEHKRASLWFSAIAEWSTLAEVEDNLEAHWYEGREIRERKPLFNMVGNGDRNAAWLNMLAYTAGHPRKPRRDLLTGEVIRARRRTP